MQRWGPLWWAPFLFLALSFSAPAAAEPGVWRDADIRDSGIETQACAAGAGQAASLAGADLVLAVREAGHELLVLDAATLATLGHCRLPQALQGTPVRSPDGRFVYAAVADSWVLRMDLQHFGALRGTCTDLTQD